MLAGSQPSLWACLSLRQEVLSGVRDVFDRKRITLLRELIEVLDRRLHAELAPNIHRPRLLLIAQQFFEGMGVRLTEEGRNVEFEFKVLTAMATMDCQDVDRTCRSVLKTLSADGGTVVGSAAAATRPTDHPVLLIMAVR